MPSIRITARFDFEVERRHPDDFNMAQLWHELSLKLPESKVEWKDILDLHIHTEPMFYLVTVHFQAITNTDDWKGWYGWNPVKVERELD